MPVVRSGQALLFFSSFDSHPDGVRGSKPADRKGRRERNKSRRQAKPNTHTHCGTSSKVPRVLVVRHAELFVLAVGGVGELQKGYQEIDSMSSTWIGGRGGCWLAGLLLLLLLFWVAGKRRGAKKVRTKKMKTAYSFSFFPLFFSFSLSNVNKTDEHYGGWLEMVIDEGEENRRIQPWSITLSYYRIEGDSKLRTLRGIGKPRDAKKIKNNVLVVGGFCATFREPSD